jgi:LAO/AO transport system kinase
VIKLLDASGKEVIFVETVGVGQTELDIMEATDTTVVVLVPESGDAVQTMKAGLFEIADIFVINKADTGRADRLAAELESMLHLSSRRSEWEVPVVVTQAVNELGIEALYQKVENHYEFLKKTGRLASRRREQRKRELLQIVERKMTRGLQKLIQRDAELSHYIEMVEIGKIDPYSAAVEVLDKSILLQRQMAGDGEPSAK